MYGWTPDIVSELTLTQAKLYLNENEKSNKIVSKLSKEKKAERFVRLVKAHAKYKGNIPQNVGDEIFRETS